VIAVLATIVFGELSDGTIHDDRLFTSLPESTFTIFRCFTGDCTTAGGAPVPYILAQSHGVLFMVVYCACVVFVTFGLFNLIFSVYIESTLSAAKSFDEKHQDRRYRESLRVAKLAKRLLQKFSRAQKESQRLERISTGSNASEDVVESEVEDANAGEIMITKELFHKVILDPDVQTLMDGMDIPPDRANLFDVFDSDFDGVLELQDLIQGILQIRGELRKSDMVASLLAVRTLHKLVRKQIKASNRLNHRLEHALFGEEAPSKRDSQHSDSVHVEV